MPFSKKDRKTLGKIRLWVMLQHGHGPTGHAYNFLSILFILLSLGILPLEFIPVFSPYQGILTTIEVITTGLFTFDYLLRIFAAPRRLHYIFSFFGIIDLLSILPFYIGLVGTQYVKILRLVRLFRLGEMEASAAEEEQQTLDKGIGLVQGETVEYVVSHHPIYLVFGCLPPIIAVSFALGALSLPLGPVGPAIAVTLLLFALVFLWKAWLDFSYDVIYVTSQRLVYQNQHILGRSINQVNYHAIMNVKPSYTSVFGYLLGYGTIIIETPAAETGHIELTMVRSHEHAVQIIMEKSLMRRQEAFY